MITIWFGDSQWTLDLNQTVLGDFNFWGTGGVGTAGPVADILNALLQYVYPMAGLIMFFLIIASGFQFLTSAGNPETMKKAQHRLTMAVVGFIIIFVSYWLIQLLDAILGLHYFTP